MRHDRHRHAKDETTSTAVTAILGTGRRGEETPPPMSDQGVVVGTGWAFTRIRATLGLSGARNLLLSVEKGGGACVGAANLRDLLCRRSDRGSATSHWRLGSLSG